MTTEWGRRAKTWISSFRGQLIVFFVLILVSFLIVRACVPHEMKTANSTNGNSASSSQDNSGAAAVASDRKTNDRAAPEDAPAERAMHIFWEVVAGITVLLIIFHFDANAISWPTIGRAVQTFSVQIVLLVVIGLIGFLIIVKQSRSFLQQYNMTPQQAMSTYWAAFGTAIILSVIFHFEEIESKPRAILFALLGAGLGWLLGMYISPKTSAERQSFATYEGALVGVLSGYVLSKVQSLITAKFQKPEDFTVRRQAYIGIFLASMILTTGAIYNVRAYGFNNHVRVSIKNFTELDTDSKDKSKDKIKDSVPQQDQFVWVTCKGKDEDDPDQGILFEAESTMPEDSSVSWTTTSGNPPGSKLLGGSFSASEPGVFVVKSTGDPEQCGGKVNILASSNTDPTVVGLYVLELRYKKPPSPKSTANSNKPAGTGAAGAADPAPKDKQSTTDKK